MLVQANTLNPMSRPAPSDPPAFYDPATYGQELSMGYLMRQVVMGLTTEVDRRLDFLDLTHAQWPPLFLLYRGMASTLAELARELHTDAGAMTRTLDRLEAKGLVRRVRCEHDRRVSRLALTEAGAAAAAQVPPVLSEVQNAYLQGFTHQEWRQLLDLLARLRANGEALRRNG